MRMKAKQLTERQQDFTARRLVRYNFRVVMAKLHINQTKFVISEAMARDGPSTHILTRPIGYCGEEHPFNQHHY